MDTKRIADMVKMMFGDKKKKMGASEDMPESESMPESAKKRSLDEEFKDTFPPKSKILDEENPDPKSKLLDEEEFSPKSKLLDELHSSDEDDEEMEDEMPKRRRGLYGDGGKGISIMIAMKNRRRPGE